MSAVPPHSGFDLTQAALQELHAAGLHPEFSPEATAQLAQILALPDPPPSPIGPLADLRDQPWSSIDNDTSRDLDQIEVAETLPAGIRLHVAIADVASLVPQDRSQDRSHDSTHYSIQDRPQQPSPLDQHAAAQTQTVYTAVHNFPMLPNELSSDRTSLNQNADRLAVVLSFTVDGQGSLLDEQVTHALVRNRAQLAYSQVGPWLQAAADPATAQPLPEQIATAQHGSVPPTFPSDWLSALLHLQDRAAGLLRAARMRDGALDFKRVEADPVVLDGRVVDLQEVTENRAMNLIEDLMVAANGVMARALRSAGRSSLQRVVRVPARWDRIVALAAGRGAHLPPQPDPVALNNFLQQQHAADNAHYPELAVGIIKLFGAGEYVLLRPDDDPAGHFGLAAHDYTHSTAPNRRFPDLVTQRLILALLAGLPAPYTDDDLAAIATHCNQTGKLLRKIDRAMQKRVAAVALTGSIGKTFSGVITGATPKGTYVRIVRPPFEGRIVQGEAGLDVGECVEVRLLHTDPARAFIDLALVGTRTC